MGFAERLSARIDQFTATDRGFRTRLARDIGVSKQLIGDWLRGATPAGDKLFRLADALGLNPRWLISGEGDPNADPGDQWLNLDQFDLFDFQDGHKPAPCAHVPVRADWFGAAVRKGVGLWVAEMPSDAMPGVAAVGELIVCRDPTLPLHDGRIYALLLDGRPIVRRVQSRPGGLLLTAENPTIEPMTLAGDELEAMIPIGQVVGSLGFREV